MFLGQMLGCVLQEAAGLLRQATDESCDWNTRIKCLSKLSHALEIEESKYEVGPPVQALAIWAFCFAHAHKPAALAMLPVGSPQLAGRKALYNPKPQVAGKACHVEGRRCICRRSLGILQET